MIFWQEHVEKFRMIMNCLGKFEGAVKLCSHIKPGGVPKLQKSLIRML
jgi:hypothetical protein